MLENTLENAKYDLMQQSDFSVINAFKFFDKSGSGFIHYWDIVDELQSLYLNIGSCEGRLFMIRYDQDKDQKLNYVEFSRAILPAFESEDKSLPMNSYISINDEHLNGLDAFSYQTKMKFLELFRVHFDIEKATERWRQSLNQLYTLSPRNAFMSLGAKDAEDYIRAKHFDNLFSKYGINLSNQELEMLVLKFTNDTSCPKISCSQFVEQLIPRSWILL